MARVSTIRVRGARLIGAELLDRKLAELASRREILEAGLEAGADIIRASAAQRAADQPELAASLGMKITTTQAGRTVALIGPEKGKSTRGFSLVALAYWREFGTKPHAIVAGAFRKVRRSRQRGGGTEAKSDKRVLASGGTIFGAKVAHPGTPARSFLLSAFVEDGPHAAHVMGQVIWERLRQITSR
ncbi:MAG TPA: hypothetical protein VGV13_00925 [Methylomirabilota bacterium]|jgi:hypothetical protein|nr:hypothetical protein [Methylomirabilota bacterium]